MTKLLQSILYTLNLANRRGPVYKLAREALNNNLCGSDNAVKAFCEYGGQIIIVPPSKTETGRVFIDVSNFRDDINA